MKNLGRLTLPLVSILLGLCVYVLNYELVHVYLSFPFLAGADGAGHWSIGEYYSTHIFPKTWGWIPVWFGGMPFPQFYPPFFYFFNALLSHLLPWVSYLSITKVIVLTSVFAAPGAAIWMAWQIFKYKEDSNTENKSSNKNPRRHRALLASILTGILSTIMLCNFGDQSSPGFTLESAINKGFVPQSFALIPVLICLGFTARIKESRAARYGAGIFFAISLLSNVHTALLLVLVISCVCLSDILRSTTGTKISRKVLSSNAWLYFKVFGTAGLACAFWFIPLLDSYDYFSTVPLQFRWDYIIPSMRAIVLIVFPVAGYIAFRKRDTVILGITLGTLLIGILAIFKVDQNFPNLPLHIYRWLALLPYMAMLLIAYIFKNIKCGIPTTYIIAASIVLATIGIYLPELTRRSDNGIFLNYERTQTDQLVEFLSLKPGLTAVGTEEDYWRSGSFVIDSKLGLAGVPTITHIIRESAPSGLFLTPVRNTFSSRAEMAGVRTYIGRDPKLLNQPMSYKIDRARALGIRYLVISDSELKLELSTSTEVDLLGTFGPRNIYEIDNYTEKITTLDILPTLVSTPLNFKARPSNQYNFTFLNEQLLLHNFYPDIILARSPEKYIDTTPDNELQNFSSWFITDFTHHDLEKAYAKIQKFSETRPVFILESRNPLYKKVFESAPYNKNIFALANPEITKKTKIQIQNDTVALFTQIKKMSTPSKGATIKPYYIRQTYFPWWKRKDNKQLYAVSPMYTLTFTDPAGQLIFTTPKSVKIGYTISLLVLTIVLIYELRGKSKKRLI